MTAMAGPLQRKGSGGRAKTDGWVAFDQKQRQSQFGATVVERDPFPPLLPSSSVAPAGGGLKGTPMGKGLLKQKNSCFSIVRPEDIWSGNTESKSCPFDKSFNAAARNFTNGSAAVDAFGRRSGPDQSTRSLALGDADNEGRALTPQGGRREVAVERLKALYGWADDSLIEDVLMAVDYDLEKAASLLESMAATSLLGSLDLSANEEAAAVEESSAEEHSGQNLHAFSKQLGLEDANDLQIAPPEPEWEEDDIYLKYRKDALRMRRAGGRHSRIAANAFLRGDHHTAKLMSMKSREEHLAADKLNAEAAAQILQIRNEKLQNNIWKLDLHGLHASEAVSALESRLQMIEYDTSNSTCDSNIGQVDKKGDGNSSSSHGTCSKSSRAVQMTYWHGQKQFSGGLSLHTWRQSELQVITGTGAHSRGGAALPMAVKSFLIDKGTQGIVLHVEKQCNIQVFGHVWKSPRKRFKQLEMAFSS